MPDFLESETEVTEFDDVVDLFGDDEDMFEESSSFDDNFQVEITYDLAEPEF
jgi:hypothetical protein